MATDDDKLSVDASTAAKSTNLPITCIEGIWNKAKELLQKENAIVLVPGQSSEAKSPIWSLQQRVEVFLATQTVLIGNRLGYVLIL